MARQFATGNSVTVAAGGAAGANRVHTVVALMQISNANASLIQGLATSTRVWSVLFDTSKPFGMDDFGAGGSSLTLNTWYVVAVSKATGSVPYRYHVAPLSTGVWTHQSSAFNVPNGSGGTTSIQFGVSETTGGNIVLAAAAEYSGALSDGAIEALGVTSMDDWLAATPRAAWQFNQASTSDAVTDLTGGAADQTAISGTTVVSDPAGWSYSTGGGGGATVAPAGLSVPVVVGSPTAAWSATVAPNGIAVPVALGAPVVGAASINPDGVTVPVALGAPTLTWSATIAPDGVAVPVALGAPTVGVAPLAPAGIAVPVTLGAPTLVWSGAVSPDGIPVPLTLGAAGTLPPYEPALVGVDSATTAGTFDSSSRQPAEYAGTTTASQVDL